MGRILRVLFEVGGSRNLQSAFSQSLRQARCSIISSSSSHTRSHYSYHTFSKKRIGLKAAIVARGDFKGKRDSQNITRAAIANLVDDAQKATTLPPSVIEARQETLYRVQRLISQYGKKYSVSLFGSTNYGVSTPDSDLDMVLLDPTDRQKKKYQALPAIYQINELADHFRDAGFVDVRPKPKARVPIINFKDPETGLTGNININDRLGLFNTLLIKQYCDIFPLLRPMLAFIKSWAKPLGYNNPSGPLPARTFSSFAFALMTIAMLQELRLVPNLQDVMPSMKTREGFWEKRHFYNTQFSRLQPDHWKVPFCLSFEETLYAWFRYWGMEYNYQGRQIVNIRFGFISPPRSTTAEYKIRVADPFVHQKRVTHNIGSHSLRRFSEDCRNVMNFLLPADVEASAVDAKIADIRDQVRIARMDGTVYQDDYDLMSHFVDEEGTGFGLRKETRDESKTEEHVLNDILAERPKRSGHSRH